MMISSSSSGSDGSRLTSSEESILLLNGVSLYVYYDHTCIACLCLYTYILAVVFKVGFQGSHQSILSISLSLLPSGSSTINPMRHAESIVS